MSGEPGGTLGVEEEFHLVDSETLGLAQRPGLAGREVDRRGGHQLHAEMLASQLEAVTDVCTGLPQLRCAIVEARRAAAAVAADAGTVLLPTSTHPLAPRSDIEVLNHPRYARLVERFGTIVREFNLCGCHVHVSVPDLSTAVSVMNHARPYLPVLAALTASSPFHEGVDTGYESFRTAWLGLWPHGGAPPRLESAEQYRTTVDQLSRLGIIDDATALLWEVRPSARFPTLEFRIADMCPDVDDVVLHAGLVRSLVRTLAARVEPAPELPDSVLRAARWRAARYGLAGQLWSPARQALVPGEVVVSDLLAELRPDLEEHGEYDLVEALWSRLRSRGTSAARQRRVFAATGNLADVVRSAIPIPASAPRRESRG
ncbi:MAG TPA: glutamate--cysteine ligase [Jatrophihabitantaceae bacterium]|jgi:carboxylate-amine ligase